jgi:predicted AAA+ superfamily ATPase
MSTKQNLIPRPDYLAKLERHRKRTDLIKILTGVRRCGKSTLFDIYQEKLRGEGLRDDQLLVIRFEDLKHKELRDGMALHQFVEAHTARDGKLTSVFLDEIQLVSGFADVINSLRLRDNIDLYVTGSNSMLLPYNLPKILGGRYIQIHMLPLSFKEYANGFPDWSAMTHEPVFPADRLFENYLEYSSFPETLAYLADNRDLAEHPAEGRSGGFVTAPRWDAQAVREYLNDIYNSILVRDILTRDGVKELSQLTRVINFMFSNIGSETSVNNMMGVINNEFKLRPHDRTLYAPMLEKYLEALLASFLFYKADVQHFGKELLRTNAKYYAVDVGLRYNLLGGAPNRDAGHILENVVYLELVRRGYKVEVGKFGSGMEVDFVAQKEGGKREYYQVAQSVRDRAVLDRELAPLEAIRDKRPKFILSRDTDSNDYEGIQHINVCRWLLR